MFAESIHRRYVLLPLLLSIALVVTGFIITESRRTETRHLAEQLRERQDVMRVLTETVNGAMAAESAQRGYLITGDARYLAPLESGLAAAHDRLQQLVDRYATLAPGELPVLRRAQAALRDKGDELRRTVSLMREGRRQESLELVGSGRGMDLMTAIDQSLQEVRVRERQRILSGIDRWSGATRLSTIINLLGTIFTIAVLIVLGLLATRDLRRREGYASQLAGEVAERTRELRELSQHMSRVSEAEKHALARELHDELGGLLLALRMDIAQLRRRAGAAQDPDTAARWERVEQALAEGVKLKGRVIEALRPTLLDNMGLFSALRWMASQGAEQAGLRLTMHGMDEDIQVPPETATAVFRTAQEAIANIVRHAGARQFSMAAYVDGGLRIEISDDGRGMPEGSAQRFGSHGIPQMRFRMESVGGTLEFASNERGGTTVRFSVPLPVPAGQLTSPLRTA